MQKIVMALLVIAILIGVALGLGACAEADHAAAARAEAEAYKIRAEAAAYTERVAANQDAADRAHQRALDNLPYIAMIGGGLLLAGFGGFIFWDIRRQMSRADSLREQQMLLMVYDQGRRLGELERAKWQHIAATQRGQLTMTERGVILHDGRK
jgi:hypothetical protein